MRPTDTGGYLDALNSQVQRSREQLTAIHQIWGQVVRALASKGIILEGCDGFDTLVRDTFGSLAEIENDATRVTGYLTRIQNVIAVSGMLASSEHYLETPVLVLDQVIALIHAERAYLFFDDGESGLRLAAGRNAGGETITEDAATFSQGMIAECRRRHEPIIVNNASADAAYRQFDSVIDYELRSIALVPLILEDRFIGVLYADNRVKEGIFSSWDVPLMAFFANLAAAALSNAQLYEKQVVANRVKDQFLANISHELRTPLAVIATNTENLLEGTYKAGNPAPAEQVPILDTILRSNRRLLSMIDEILEYRQLEDGRGQRPHIAPTDLSFVERVIGDLLPDAERKGLALCLLIDPSAPDEIQGDVAKFERILVNLTHNAIKFTLQGAVEVRVTGSASAWSIQVKDTGIGIAPEHLDKIFDRFYQVETTDSRRFRGVGLGLSIVKDLVEILQGQISVESTLGVGSTFTVTLPTVCGSQDGSF